MPISGVDNVSDRLVPNQSGTSFMTEHVSRLNIDRVGSGDTACFNVWDTSGNEYLFGCTTDSLQYNTDSSGTRHNYQWDLNGIVLANEGPGSAINSITITYLQDSISKYGSTTIRASAIKQITYGDQSGALAGTVDFSYRAPFTSSPWAQAYGNNEQGCAPPDGLTTTLRCDDPLDHANGLNAPAVMSTFSLQSVTSYVGTDQSANNKAYGYSFSYSDSPFGQCWDDYSQVQMYCAGNHLLNSVTPIVYHQGAAHQLKGLAFTYQVLTDNYIDMGHTIQNGSAPYSIQTYWQYLVSYYDSNSGAGASPTSRRTTTPRERPTVMAITGSIPSIVITMPAPTLSVLLTIWPGASRS